MSLLPTIALATEPTILRQGSCRDRELSGRTIRHVSLHSPVPSPRPSSTERLRALLGPTYSDAAAARALASLAPTEPTLSALPLDASIFTLTASNCQDNSPHPTLDLDFFSLPLQIPFFTNPLAAPGPRAWTVQPRFEYSPSAGIVSGLTTTWKSTHPLFDRYTLATAASANVSRVTLAAEADRTSRHPALHLLNYRVAFFSQNEPNRTESNRLSSLSLAANAASAPIGPAALQFRYGAQASASQQLSSTRFFTLTTFLNASLRSTHQAFQSTYALDASAGHHTAYLRQFLDLSYKLSWSPAHYPIEIDTRLSAGRLDHLCRFQSTCIIPLSAQFQGGNSDKNLLSGVAPVRSQPLLRGLPLNSFFLPTPSGANRFWALNLTAAVAVWRLPLIPQALLSQPEFLSRMDALPGTVEQLLASEYARADASLDSDPALSPARQSLSALTTDAARALTLWDTLEPFIPPAQQESFSICRDDQLTILTLDLDDVTAHRKPLALLANTSGSLIKTARCLLQFSPSPTHELSLLAARFSSARASIAQAIESTGSYRRAQNKARTDMLLARQTVHSLFHHANFASLSPFVLFDAAALGQSRWTQQLRYSYGGGLRLTIVNTLRLGVGYAVNPHRLPTQPRGALFGTLELLDLLPR